MKDYSEFMNENCKPLFITDILKQKSYNYTSNYTKENYSYNFSTTENLTITVEENLNHNQITQEFPFLKSIFIRKRTTVVHNVTGYEFSLISLF